MSNDMHSALRAEPAGQHDAGAAALPRWDLYKTGVLPWSHRIQSNQTLEVISDAMQSELTDLRKLVVKLRAAVQPFADLAELYDDANRGNGMPSTGLIHSWPRMHKEYEMTVEHLRAAREALKPALSVPRVRGEHETQPEE